MTAKRWDGSAFQSILTTKKRWDGASWVTLTTAKRWDGASWIDITDLLGGGLSVSVSPAQAVGDVFMAEPAPSFRVVSSDSALATPSGGTGPYTYLWTKVSGSVGTNVSSSTAASVSFSATVGKNQSKDAIWRVTVTDALLATASALVSVSLSYSTDI